MEKTLSAGLLGRLLPAGRWCPSEGSLSETVGQRNFLEVEHARIAR